MTKNNTKRALKIAFVITAIAAIIIFMSVMNLLQYAHTKNPEYAKWQMLPDKTKNLKTEDGQPVYPTPAKQRQLTKEEIMALSAGLTFFSCMSVFFICFAISRRRK